MGNDSDGGDGPGPSGSITEHIGLVKTFSGEIGSNLSISDFFKAFERVSKIAKWSDEEQILVLGVKMKGVAQTYFNTNPTVNAATKYEVVKEALLRRFGMGLVPTLALSQIMHCKQLKDELVVDYSIRLEEIRCRINSFQSEGGSDNINETMLRGIFVEGLDPIIRQSMFGRDCPSYADAVKLAADIQQQMATSKGTKSTVMVSQMTPNLNGAQGNSTTGISKMEDLLEGLVAGLAKLNEQVDGWEKSHKPPDVSVATPSRVPGPPQHISPVYGSQMGLPGMNIPAYPNYSYVPTPWHNPNYPPPPPSNGLSQNGGSPLNGQPGGSRRSRFRSRGPRGKQ